MRLSSRPSWLSTLLNLILYSLQLKWWVTSSWIPSCFPWWFMSAYLNRTAMTPSHCHCDTIDTKSQIAVVGSLLIHAGNWQRSSGQAGAIGPDVWPRDHPRSHQSGKHGARAVRIRAYQYQNHINLTETQFWGWGAIARWSTWLLTGSVAVLIKHALPAYWAGTCRLLLS